MAEVNSDVKRTVKWAYWVNIASTYAQLTGVIKVDFEVRLGSDVKKLLSFATKDWSPSHSWGARLISYTPMPAENEVS